MHGTINSTEDLGRAVRAARLAYGMTQAQLATSMGLTQRYVSELENGKSKTLSTKLFDLLDQLGIQLSFRITADDGGASTSQMSDTPALQRAVS